MGRNESFLSYQKFLRLWILSTEIEESKQVPTIILNGLMENHSAKMEWVLSADPIVWTKARDESFVHANEEVQSTLGQ